MEMRFDLHISVLFLKAREGLAVFKVPLNAHLQTDFGFFLGRMFCNPEEVTDGTKYPHWLNNI